MNDEIIFVDTNILVYAYDAFDKEKQKRCRAIVGAAFQGQGRFAVSNQVLAELFVVLTKKLKKPFPLDEAEAIVSGIIDSTQWVKLDYTAETVKHAVARCKSQHVPLWDALIVETVLENGITKIMTENTKDFRGNAKLIVRNPFAEGK